MELTPQNFYAFQFAYSQAVIAGKLIFGYGSQTFSTSYAKYVIDTFKDTSIARVLSESEMDKIANTNLFTIEQIDTIFKDLELYTHHYHANEGISGYDIIKWWCTERQKLLQHEH